MTKEEAINYLQQLYPNGGHCCLDKQRIEAIGMAVEALKEKEMQSTIELAEDHAMLAGMEKMKEQLMAKAIDGHATFEFYGLDSKTYGTIAHNPICLDDLGLKDTDKVKVIVIKED